MRRGLRVAAAGLCGCSLFQDQVSVYVDNGGREPIEVAVDRRRARRRPAAAWAS